jgi:hypothetical protein
VDNLGQAADLAVELSRLRPKKKEPVSTRVLDSWIAQIENSIDKDQAGRLSWLVASTLVTAVLQRVIGETGTSRFLLKGGALLQHRLGGLARATQDVDGIVCGDIETFIADMDRALGEPWGPITFSHGNIEVIEVPTKIIKPRRFDVSLSLRGKTWRRISVDISPDEGKATNTPESFSVPSLDGLGLPTPDQLVGIAMSYQIAQKVHAATEPHDPPAFVNERARDAVDLLLLKTLVESGNPDSQTILSAIQDIFAARATETEMLNRSPRNWPVRLSALPGWYDDYSIAAAQVGIRQTLDETVQILNEWLDALG